MIIKDFFSKYINHPVLFIGSGFSMRYINNFRDWDGLLSDVAVELYDNDERYLDIKSKHFSENKYHFDKIASDIEADFNKNAEENRNGRFKKYNDIFYENMKIGVNISRFKIYIADKLQSYTIKNGMEDEIQELKKVRKNISSVITTNYDTFIEDVFKFVPLIGNDILLSNPYGSVYKIHGCVSDPNKIIINEEDYLNFHQKYELIRAQLMSIFIHNPIIFFGYSISDDNIKSLLKTIFTYVEHNSTLSKKIRSNFLLVEYEKDSNNLEVIEHDIEIEGIATVRINKIKTDDFTTIYKELARIHLPVSAMDIRKVRSVVKDIQTGEGGIKVTITEDLDELKNSDKILVIGSQNTIQYDYQNKSELLSNYFKIIEEENTGILSLIDKYRIQKTQYFPIFGFSKINSSIKSEQDLKFQQINKLREYIIDRKVHQTFSSIDEILDDVNIAKTYKSDYIIDSSLRRKIPIEELEKYIKNIPDHKKKDTNYKRLLCTYDLLNYSNENLFE